MRPAALSAFIYRFFSQNIRNRPLLACLLVAPVPATASAHEADNSHSHTADSKSHFTIKTEGDTRIIKANGLPAQAGPVPPPLRPRPSTDIIEDSLISPSPSGRPVVSYVELGPG
jgi:hypothetical protein